MGIITSLFPFLAPKSGAKWRLKNGTYHITGDVVIEDKNVFIDGELVPELDGHTMKRLNVTGSVVLNGKKNVSVTCSGTFVGGSIKVGNSINIDGNIRGGRIQIGPHGISGGGIEIGPNGIRIGT